MLFVLSGPSYVGKKTAVNHFMTLYSFSSIVPYTTKPISHRTGETEGIQYHYAEEEEIVNAKFIYDRPFNSDNSDGYRENTVYAYRKHDLEIAINSDDNFIIHASTGNVEQMYELFKKYHTKQSYQDDTWTQRIYFIFLNFKSQLTKDFFRTKIPKKEVNSDLRIRINSLGRQKDKIQERKSDDETRRFTHAKKEIAFYENQRKIFHHLVKSDDRFVICEELENVILNNVYVRPTSPDQIPGPLSDVDIIYMCEKRDEDAMHVRINGKEASIEEIKELLCGCGLHIRLNDEIRMVRMSSFNRFIDMAGRKEDIKTILGRAYPSKFINKGYMLRPYEMILCSSVESIRLPRDVYAMVMAKFSYTQLGLSVELSPNIIQGGHEGKIHFQIKNNTGNYIWIYPQIQVAQVIFFRTVQQSRKNYNKDENHAYDEESSPPLSKFREMNPALDNVAKPRAGVIEEILQKLKDKVSTVVVGLVVTMFFVLFGALPTQQLLNYFASVIDNLPLAVLVMLFAITCCVVNAAVYIIGFICIKLLNLLYCVICNAMRKKSTSKNQT